MTREEIKDFCDMKVQLEPENEDIYKAIVKILEQEPTKLTNSEMINFLVNQFDISRTSAKEMLHEMMTVKRMDNIKKQFSGSKNDKIE